MASLKEQQQNSKAVMKEREDVAMNARKGFKVSDNSSSACLLYIDGLVMMKIVMFWEGKASAGSGEEDYGSSRW